MTLKPKGMSQCYCDVTDEDPCIHCMLTGEPKVTHTEEEKEIIRGWERERIKYIKEAVNMFDKVKQGVTCRDCGKEFVVEGGKIDTCKECTLKILNDPKRYYED